MNFDQLANDLAKSNPPTTQEVLAVIVPLDLEELATMKASALGHPELTKAIELIDVYSAFQTAKKKLDDAQLAAEDLATQARLLISNNDLTSAIADTSLIRAKNATLAASDAMDQASTRREKIDAAVVLELAEQAEKQAKDAAEAAHRLTEIINQLLHATSIPKP